MKNIRTNIISGVLLFLLAGGVLNSCQEDDFAPAILPDRDSLIASGRYLTARSMETPAAFSDPNDADWFQVGTLYRLLAFAKSYSSDDADNEEAATYPRFNKVAWEGEAGNLRFINLTSSPDYWFGFSAIGDEPKDGTHGLVSLDFYSFTYGKPADRTDNYLTIDGLDGETLPGQGDLATLKRTEYVTDESTLNDLMRAQLPNQNITTAGSGSSLTQSILPFRHCFSKLCFKTVQQPKEGTEDQPSFEDIYVERIEVTGTYSEGAVYLQNGKVELKDQNKYTREFKMRPDYSGPVTTNEIEMGEMIIFPSDGAALTSGTSYLVGLNITVKGKDQTVIGKFLANSGGGEVIDGGDGFFYGTISREHIVDNYTNQPLYFKQNTKYTLVISFQDDAVRVITVIPQVEDWIQGEGDADDPWQDIPLGQPQMFDNILWSDRNLGADDYDPIGGNFERTIGYFYQSGRNIPYYPFNKYDYYPANTTQNDRNAVMDSVPTPAHKYLHSLADALSWTNSTHRFYPMVDDMILNMKHKDNGNGTDGGNENRTDRTWTIEQGDAAQMFIPESSSGTGYFDFKRGKASNGLTSDEDMHWEDGLQNQPVTGSWILPSSDDFMTIFPSTPFAGNITFQTGDNFYNYQNMNWCNWTGLISDEYKTLRVTVPYYNEGTDVPTGKSDMYKRAWDTLKSNESKDDAGTSLDGYNIGPNNDEYVQHEPDGDPEAGFASVYVISREEGSKEAPAGIPSKYVVKSWGTIYAIKRVYTPQAYRMRWRVVSSGTYGKNKLPGLYVEVCRYRCEAHSHLNQKNYMTYDWEHPAARIYFPICGLGDWTGIYINFGTECQYATSDKIKNGYTSAVHMKVTGETSNIFICVVKDVMNRNFAKQIRPVGGGNH